MAIVHNLREYVIGQATRKTVLYIGAGNDGGELATSVVRILDVAKKWYGLDRDPAVAAQRPDLEIATVDLDGPFTIDFPDIELVVMTEVLEHLQFPSNALRQLGKSLPGVRFLGSVPNGVSIGRFLMALLKPSLYNRQDGWHTMLFNQNTLKRTLANGCLGDVVLTPYEQRSFFRPLVRFRSDLASGFVIEGTLGAKAKE